jgi:hypothetical protein
LLVRVPEESFRTKSTFDDATAENGEGAPRSFARLSNIVIRWTKLFVRPASPAKNSHDLKIGARVERRAC